MLGDDRPDQVAAGDELALGLPEFLVLGIPVGIQVSEIGVGFLLITNVLSQASVRALGEAPSWAVAKIG